MEIQILQDILGTNKEMAADIRSILAAKKIYMINFMSSPGSGKTTIVDYIINRLKGDYRIAVIEGDIKTTTDSEKLAKHDIPIIQIETERFGGDCHLESSWIKKCLDSFNLDALDFIIIENIGNLVCPAEFQLGDDERIIVLSVTEGEDKPIKYPLAFNTSQTILVNKIDLLPHLTIDLDALLANIRKVNPAVELFQVSGAKGNGMDSFIDHLTDRIDRKKGL